MTSPHNLNMFAFPRAMLVSWEVADMQWWTRLAGGPAGTRCGRSGPFAGARRPATFGFAPSAREGLLDRGRVEDAVDGAVVPFARDLRHHLAVEGDAPG